MAVKRKDESIEALRGIAIIALVGAHIIADKNTRGLMVEDDSIWRYFYHSIEFLRMPLFTVISGYVYGLKPVKKGFSLSFIKGKARRVLLPFFFVASFQYIVNFIIPNVNQTVEIEEIWRIYLYSYGQFWFLQALFFVFITVAILEINGITAQFKGWIVCILVAISLLFFLHPHIKTTLFSFIFYLYLLPYFLLGLGLNRFSKILFNTKILIIVLSFLIVGVILQQLSWFKIVEVPSSKYGILGSIVGFSGTWLIIHIRRPIRFLAYFGYFSYGIYLFHVFGTAGSRIISRLIGIEQLLVLFLVGMIFGLGVPIFMEWIIMKSKVLRLLFLGLK